MIFITQLIYLLDGQAAIFNEFEALAIPLIPRYNGRLLFRLRPGDAAYIECEIERPYEIHLVTFETEKDFSDFMQDEERKSFLHLKNQSIRSAWILKGEKI